MVKGYVSSLGRYKNKRNMMITTMATFDRRKLRTERSCGYKSETENDNGEGIAFLGQFLECFQRRCGLGGKQDTVH